MGEQKNLFFFLGEWWAQRSKARIATPDSPPGHLRRFLRWLVPNGGTILVVLTLVLTQQVWARPVPQQVHAPGPSATTVNYQGRLADPAGNPLDGNFGMTFSLWDAPSGGALVWGPENHPALPVSGGLFSAGLGSLTSGGIPTTVWNGDRYLEIIVGGETLSPRELIRSVPIAGMALTVPDGAIGTAQIADGAIGSRHFAPSWYQTHATSIIVTTSQEPVPTGVSIEFACENNCTALILHRGAVAHSDQDGRVDVQVVVDGQVVFKELGVSNIVGTTGPGWQQVLGFDFVNLAAGPHTVKVEFMCDVVSPGTCYYFGGGEWEKLYILVFSQP